MGRASRRDTWSIYPILLLLEGMFVLRPYLRLWRSLPPSHNLLFIIESYEDLLYKSLRGMPHDAMDLGF